jgi:hypothetical protein
METLQVYGYLGVSDSGGLETSTNSEIEGNIMSFFSVSVSWEENIQFPGLVSS